MDPIYWSFLLLAAGFAFVLLEVFLPSAGLLGIMAGCFLFAGIVFAFMDGYTTGTIVLLLTFLAVPIYLWMMVHIWPHTPIGKLILLNDPRADKDSPSSEQYRKMTGLIGQIGVAKSEMILSGQIVVAEEKYDAISDGFPIEAGTPIKVVAVKGNRIYVEAYDAETAVSEDLPVRDRDVLSTPIEELGLDLDETS